MYKLITENNDIIFQKFFNFKNSFHLPDQSGKIYYLNEETNDTKEVEIVTQQINIEDFIEGDDLESVFIFIPEVTELQYYVARVKNILE